MIHRSELLDMGRRGVRFVRSSEGWPAEEELVAAGIRVFDIDGTAIGGDADLFRLLEASLRLPYFGHNWDALNDVLRDMTWLPAKAYVLRIHAAERLWAQAPATAGDLVETVLFVRPDTAGFGYAVVLFFVWEGDVDGGDG